MDPPKHLTDLPRTLRRSTPHGSLRSPGVQGTPLLSNAVANTLPSAIAPGAPAQAVRREIGSSARLQCHRGPYSPPPRRHLVGQAAISHSPAGHVPSSALKGSRAPRPIRMADVKEQGRVRARAAAVRIKARSRVGCGPQRGVGAGCGSRVVLSPSVCALKRAVNPAISPPRVPIIL